MVYNWLLEKKPLYFNFWFWFALLYISIQNLLVFKATPEIIALQFAILILFLRRNQFHKYLKDWLPFIGFFLLYEFLRGFADNYSPFYETTLFWIYRVEKALFPVLPTVYLQAKFMGNALVLNLAYFFYSIFFYYSFLAAFIIWLKNQRDFVDYSRKLIVMSFIGLLFFFLIPTAPPWLVAEKFTVPIERPIYQNMTLYRHGTLLYHFVKKNPVAALPSLHVAWPMFTSLFLIKKFKQRYSYLLLIIPLAIGFSVVLTGEHFLLDVIAGYLLAFAVFIPSNRRGQPDTKSPKSGRSPR